MSNVSWGLLLKKGCSHLSILKVLAAVKEQKNNLFKILNIDHDSPNHEPKPVKMTNIFSTKEFQEIISLVD